MTNVATLHLEELKKELDEYKELSANRLQEIDKLNEEKAQAVNDFDKLKMDVRIAGSWSLRWTLINVFDSFF